MTFWPAGGRVRRLVLAACLFALSPAVADAASEKASQPAGLTPGLPAARPDFPLPDDPNVLFFIQRSMNANTVVYAAAPGAGPPDCGSPIEAFWRRFDTNGARKPLSFLERSAAYGVKTRPGSVAGECEVRFVALPGRKLTLRRKADGGLRLSVRIAGRPAIPVYAYVELDESGLVPRVERVRVYGIDEASGRGVVETVEASGR